MAGTPSDDPALPWQRCMSCTAPVDYKKKVCFLPCLHVLCAETCVYNFITGCDNRDDGKIILKCRSCSKIVPSVNDLNGRVKLEDFLPLRPRLADLILKCEYCVLDNPAVKYCTDCEINMCRECSEYHEIEKRGCQHTQEALPEEHSVERYKRIVASWNMCMLHKKKDFLQFCFTCQTKLCEVCRQNHDQEHCISSIAEGVEDARRNLLLLSSMEDVALAQASKLRDRLSTLEQIEFKEFEKEMRDTADRITQEIQQRCEIYIIKGRRLCELTKRHIQRKIEFFMHAAYDASELKNVCEHVNKNEDDVGVMNIAKLTEGVNSENVCQVNSAPSATAAPSLQIRHEASQLPSPRRSIRLLKKKELRNLAKSAKLQPSKKRNKFKKPFNRLVSTTTTSGGASSSTSSFAAVATAANIAAATSIIAATASSTTLAAAATATTIAAAASTATATTDAPFVVPVYDTAATPTTTAGGSYGDATPTTAATTKRRTTSAIEELLKRKRLHKQCNSKSSNSGVVAASPSTSNAISLSKKQSSTNEKSSSASLYAAVPPSSNSEEKAMPENSRNADILELPQNHAGQADNQDSCCSVCKETGDEAILSCDKCSRLFHLNCHIPPESTDTLSAATWHCNFHKSKLQVERELRKFNEIPNAENKQLVRANPREFHRACKFFAEVHKILQMPLKRGENVNAYCSKFDAVPRRLRNIRDRLCGSSRMDLEPFSNVVAFLYAIERLFFDVFKTILHSNGRPGEALVCYKSFENLVGQYYPHHQRRLNTLERN